MRRSLCVLALLTILAWGCTPVRYREAADTETYRIIEQKQTEVFGKALADFSIEKQPLPEFIRGVEGVQAQEPAPEGKPEAAQPSPDAAAVPVVTGFSEEEIEKLADEEKDKALEALLNLSNEELAKLIVPPPPNAVKPTLAQALQLGVVNGRDFQTQKEALFLQALSLTYQRHLWRPQLGLTTSATGERTGDEKSVAADTKFSLGQAIASGAKIALNLGTNFAEFLTGDKRRAVGSLLSFTFTQPFLKGGGRLVAMENLTQAERNVIYSVRSFARYQKEFSVDDVARGYYEVIRARDTLINTFRNYLSLWQGRIRDEELQKKARITMLDVYEGEQAELSGRNSWISAYQAYLDQLDGFKISPLGMPTEAPIVLDENELEVLRKKGEGGLPPPVVPLEEAVKRAMEKRLDLVTAGDELEDSERAVAIARDALRAGLDITVSSSAQTEAPTKAVKFQFDEGSYSAGLSADLPIDRKQERNSYRQALIALESQKRSVSLLRDNIKLQVRQAYRNLEQARQSFEIQKKSLELARIRVDNAKIQQELGRKITRDVLLAKDSLLRAQNDMTSALVNYEMARLRLRLSMEELTVDERGLWVEEKITERGDENVESAERTEGKKEELPKS